MVTKAQQREATIEKLIEVARQVFTEQGYANAATEDIVHQAGVTRGALYHHFKSKEGLFQAVLGAVQADVAQRITEASEQYEDTWQQLKAGCVAFLQSSDDPQVQRIMLTDAPAVLGWSVWRELDAQHSMKTLHEALETLIEQGEIPPLPITALTHLLSGAMNEAALWIAQSQHPTALEEAVTALDYLLESLKVKR
jgi:AcrR family transcriptional regulator